MKHVPNDCTMGIASGDEQQDEEQEKHNDNCVERAKLKVSIIYQRSCCCMCVIDSNNVNSGYHRSYSLSHTYQYMVHPISFLVSMMEIRYRTILRHASCTGRCRWNQDRKIDLCFTPTLPSTANREMVGLLLVELNVHNVNNYNFYVRYFSSF
jgi:hypothetical protein